MGIANKGAKFGVHLNFHPSRKVKRVVLHALPCAHYKEHRSISGGVYSRDKNCDSFSSAVERASEWALDWHAPIKACKDCVKAGRLPR